MFLCPSVPYGWPEKEATIILKSRYGKRLNVLGVMNLNNEIEYEFYSGKLNSDRLIEFLDEFSQNLKKRTVGVMVQASIHRSNAVINKIEEWLANK